MGGVLALTLGALMWARIALVGHEPQLAVAVALAMGGVAVLANLVGASMPFLFQLLKVDPAVTSSPFISTVMDVVGLMVYFWVAKVVLF